MLPDTLTFVDIETTGTSATYGRVIEIGILRIENGEIVKTYNSLINPQRYLPPEITMITGITSKDIENAPTFREIGLEIHELLSDAVFVAHNVRFDYSFLKNEFARLELPFSPKHFCTVRLSRMLFPQHRHHNLDSIIARFSITCENRHRALDDAKVLYDFYNILQKTIEPAVLATAVNKGLKKPSIPLKLQNGTMESLPESPGVYIFYGSESALTDEIACERSETREESQDEVRDRLLDRRGQEPTLSPSSRAFEVQTSVEQSHDKRKTIVPLYIGKSINIRERVMSHFSADIRSSTEMKIAQQIESIETITTAGELGALFLESQLVKQMLPLYNRQLRLKRELVALKKKTDGDGYETAYIETLSHVEVKDLDNFISFFRSKKQAKDYLIKIAHVHDLCEKLLGLEKTTTACFAHRLGRCHGACVKKESPLRYNIRFVEAFGNERLLPWPFKGPILIEEKNELNSKNEFFLIDRWCYLGTVKTDKNDVFDEEITKEYQFDLDTYKILARFMRNPKNMKKIRQLNPEMTENLQAFRSSSL